MTFFKLRQVLYIFWLNFIKLLYIIWNIRSNTVSIYFDQSIYSLISEYILCSVSFLVSEYSVQWVYINILCSLSTLFFDYFVQWVYTLISEHIPVGIYSLYLSEYITSKRGAGVPVHIYSLVDEIFSWTNNIWLLQI